MTRGLFHIEFDKEVRKIATAYQDGEWTLEEESETTEHLEVDEIMDWYASNPGPNFCENSERIQAERLDDYHSERGSL